MNKVPEEVGRAAENALDQQITVIDSNHDGGFSKEEFLVYCKANGVDDNYAESMFYAFDNDGDGGVSRYGLEFIRKVLYSMNEEQIRALAKEGKEPDYVKKQTEKINKAREELKSKESVRF